MKSLVLLQLVVLGCAGTVVRADDGTALSRMSRRVINEYRGQGYEMVVTESDLGATPRWEESEDNPPLSARKAARIARRHVVIQFTEAARWRLASIALLPTSVEKRWIYLVSFDPTPPDAIEKVWNPFDVVVLMNGDPVVMKLRPRSQ